MKKRNPIGVLLLGLVTLGIYGLVWEVKTKEEMKSQGADIPTAWLLIIPLVNYYWIWKYGEGVEKVTNGKMTGVIAFILLVLLGIIGMAVIQTEFNKLVAEPSTAGPATPAPQPTAPMASTPVPMPTPTPPVDQPPTSPISS